MTDSKYTKTSEEAFNVPVFRFTGTSESFAILNNLSKDGVELPVGVLDTVIETLKGYSIYLKSLEDN